ncbi:MAG: amidohydrolase family protein [Myxococcota bacterium]
MEIRDDVLALVKEEILEPERPIIDPHHHFFDTIQGFPSYSLADLQADTAGHNVEKTVYLQCGEHHRDGGPEPLRPVGETEWVDSVAREAAKAPGGLRIGAMVGTADLCLGAAVEEVLHAHEAASPLFRGIRDSAAWAEGEGIHKAASVGHAGLYQDAKFREGFAVLGRLGLSFDAYQYHTQTLSLRELAEAFPDVTIVCDHLSTPLGIGPFAGDAKREEIFGQWRKDVTALASCENVVMKLGGMAMPWNGFGWDQASRPPPSDDFVAAQRRYYDHAIEAFGARRCMFESNFPVDKLSLSYDVLWNGFKKIAAGASEDEKQALFYGTAERVYRI